MKFCVSNRQSDTVLKKANEISVPFKDQDTIPDLALKNPGADIILRISADDVDEIDWDKFKKLSRKLPIIFCTEDITIDKKCKINNIPFYWAFPITSYYELKGLNYIGVSQFLLGPPLSFDLQLIKERFGRPIRLIANVCFDSYINQKDGICGSYVRPEDVIKYEKYVDSLEFARVTKDQEEVLFRVYAEDRTWPGNLRLLLTNFMYDVDNRGIPNEFAEARMNCRQNCMRTGTCKFCYTAVNFGNVMDNYVHRKV